MQFQQRLSNKLDFIESLKIERCFRPSARNIIEQACSFAIRDSQVTYLKKPDATTSAQGTAINTQLLMNPLNTDILPKLQTDNEFPKNASLSNQTSQFNYQLISQSYLNHDATLTRKEQQDGYILTEKDDHSQKMTQIQQIPNIAQIAAASLQNNSIGANLFDNKFYKSQNPAYMNNFDLSHFSQKYAQCIKNEQDIFLAPDKVENKLYGNYFMSNNDQVQHQQIANNIPKIKSAFLESQDVQELDDRFNNQISESHLAVTENLNKLNQELDSSKAKKKKLSLPKNPYNQNNLQYLQEEDNQYRKRKIPLNSTLYEEQNIQMFKDGHKSDSLNHWRSQIKSSIQGETQNESFKERRRELIQTLKETQDNKQNLIVAKPKRNHTNVNQQGFRGSIYRGVSKNKNKWQMMIMGNFKKMYVGAIDQERDAALLYDKVAILTHGLKAKTNFSYQKEEIVQFLTSEDVFSEQPTFGLMTELEQQ